jgi:hypothetical protein
MGLFDLLFQLLGFALPAIVLALLMPLAARWLVRSSAPLVLRYWKQALLCLAVGLLALTAGLWLFGRDGKMTSYAALVLSVATAQWLMLGAWRGR